MRVPGGVFLMGCVDASVDPECAWAPFGDESPAHSVTLSAFELDRTEVTQRAYERCVAAGCCEAPRDDYDPATSPEFPVVDVTRQQARDYCEWVGNRLPTEAEWEKAARGTDARVFPWGNEQPTCDLANFDLCGGPRGPHAQAVGILPAGASPYGALDMAGNVYEWTADWYASDYYAHSAPTDPAGPNSGTLGVVRGGCFRSCSGTVGPLDLCDMRSAFRTMFYPNRADGTIGFRCARSD